MPAACPEPTTKDSYASMLSDMEALQNTTPLPASVHSDSMVFNRVNNAILVTATRQPAGLKQSAER